MDVLKIFLNIQKMAIFKVVTYLKGLSLSLSLFLSFYLYISIYICYVIKHVHIPIYMLCDQARTYTYIYMLCDQARTYIYIFPISGPDVTNGVFTISFIKQKTKLSCHSLYNTCTC